MEKEDNTTQSSQTDTTKPSQTDTIKCFCTCTDCNGCDRKKEGACGKLNTCDWQNDMMNIKIPDVVEVCFKHTTKGIFKNIYQIRLKKEDLVVVKASSGYDIGRVGLVNQLAVRKFQIENPKASIDKISTILRKANKEDIEQWQSFVAKEKSILKQTQEIVNEMVINMKVIDVEYQGDGTRAIFYFVAEKRIDFRDLVKKMAQSLKLRIEMKQIGGRQESARIGGFGTCGRTLCCSSWLTHFDTIKISAIQHQDISFNPQKIVGQCGKLKCCMNYELSTYLAAKKKFPPANIPLHTQAGTYRFQRADILKGVLWYARADDPNNPVGISANQAKEVIEANKAGNKPPALADNHKSTQPTIDNDAVSFKSGIAEIKPTSKPKNKRPKPRKKVEKKESEQP